MKSLLGISLDRSDLTEAALPLTPGDGTSFVRNAVVKIVGHGAASIFDQAVVSGTNFLTTLIIARACSQEELGIFSLASTVVLFLTAVQANLITVPYTMYCHQNEGDSLAEYGGSTLIHQLFTSLVAVSCFLAVAVVVSAGYGPAGLRSASLVLLGVIPFILLREYARRFAIAHLAMTVAVMVDVVVSVLQITTLLVLRHFGELSAASVYATMGGACAIAAVCWWLFDRQPIAICRRRLVLDWVRNWSFGRWAMLSQLTGLGFYVLPWLLASVHGEAETGELAACGTLVGLSNLFVIGLNNILMPKAARAFVADGSRGLFGVLRIATTCCAVVLGGLCIGAYFVGGILAGFIFGPEYADTGPLVTMLALATFVDSLSLTASTGLWAMDRPAMGLIGDVIQLVATLGLAICLVSPFGAIGITVALTVGRAAGAATRWATIWLLTQTNSFAPTPA